MPQALWTVVFVVVVLGGAVWFFNNFERCPTGTGPATTARRAATPSSPPSGCSTRMGMRVRHLKTPTELRELPPTAR